MQPLKHYFVIKAIICRSYPLWPILLQGNLICVTRFLHCYWFCFYSPFMRSVSEAKKNMKSVRKEGIATDEICPTCGRPIIIKWGRRGRFLSCSGFPKCKYAKSITSGVKCPEEGCEGELVERKSRRGAFYGCTKYPACKFTSRRLPKEDSEPAKNV